MRHEDLTQRPEYAPIHFAGHDAGDFLFVPAALNSTAGISSPARPAGAGEALMHEQGDQDDDGNRYAKKEQEQ